MNKKYNSDKIKELYLNGNSYREICDILNIKSMSTVGRTLKRIGVKPRGNSEGVIITYRNGRKVWNKGKRIPVDIIKVEKMYKEKEMSLKDISKVLGVDAMTIYNRMKENRIKTRDKRIHTDRSRKKQNKLMTGRKNPGQSKRMKENNPSRLPHVREEVSKRASGEGNYFWQGGESFEPYNKNFNNRFKRMIRKRDNQICMLCNIHREKIRRALNVHHINYNKLLSIPENCICLCDTCHGKTHFKRKHWMNFFQSILKEKYNYIYSEKNEPIIDINIKETINAK